MTAQAAFGDHKPNVTHSTVRESIGDQGTSDIRAGLPMLAGLFLLFAGLTLWWLHLHRAPPNWDDAYYLANSLSLYDAWHTGGLLGLARAFLAALGFKAPLVIALPLPFYWIFGRRWHAAFLVNVVAMLVLFAAVYRIGQRIRSRQAAIIAVYVLGTLPLIYGLARWYMVEYAMTALVALTYWLALEAADNFNLAPSVALGVVCGLGLLLKADFPVFALPILIYAFHRRASHRLPLVLSILAPCLVLAAPWYLYHWRATLDNAIAAGYGPSALVQGTGPIFSVKAISAYFSLVADRGVSVYYLVLGSAASIVLIFQRRLNVFRQAISLLLWLIPFSLFLLGGNKDVRYIAPILPAFALAIACCVDAATEGRRWIAAAVLIFPFVSLLAISFGWPYRTRDAGYAQIYGPNTWGQDEILTAIAGDGVYRYGERKTILLATDRERFNADNFQLAVMQRQLPLQVETTTYDDSADGVVRHANGAAWVVYKEGGEPESEFFNKYHSELVAWLRRSPDWQEMAFSLRTPDGGTVRIFRHK